MSVPKPDPAYFAAFGQFVIQNNYFSVTDMNGYFIPFSVARHPDPVAHNFPLWNSRFTLHQQRIHTQAISDSHLIDARPQYHVSSCFVKRENTLKGTALGTTPFSPRAIQSRHPFYSASVGPSILSVANRLKEDWNGQPQNIGGRRIALVYTSGRNAKTVCKPFELFHFDTTIDAVILLLGDDSLVCLRTKTGVLYIEVDFSRFDAHVQTQHLGLLRMRYKFHGVSASVLNLMKSELQTQGVTAHGIKYTVPGRRRSGDPTTSEGNTFLNGAMMMFALEQAQAYTSVANARNVHLFLKPLGMVPTPIYHETPHAVSFCSSYFLPCVSNGKTRFVLTPKLGRVISKSHWNFSDIPDQAWGNTVAYNQAIDYSHLPVYRQLANIMLKHTTGPKCKLPNDAHNFHLLRPVEESPLIYYYYEQIYGLNKAQILDLEYTISAIERLPAVISGPAVARIVEVDVAPEPPLTPAPNAYNNHFPLVAVGSFTPMFVASAKLAFHLVVVCPIWEEVAKRIHPVIKHGLIWGEFASYVYPFIHTSALVPMLLIRTVVAAGHYYCAAQTYRKGVYIHAMWNALTALPMLAFAWLEPSLPVE
jgi:hypothetical protein